MKENKKVTHGISISGPIWGMAEVEAKKENRSTSNWIEGIIWKELVKRGVITKG